MQSVASQLIDNPEHKLPLSRHPSQEFRICDFVARDGSEKPFDHRPEPERVLPLVRFFGHWKKDIVIMVAIASNIERGWSEC